MHKNEPGIYLDYAAATPLSKAARAAMEPYFSEQFFNPNSPYLPAKRVREAYEAAKDALAHTIGAKGDDLVVTSGATEANNLAFTVLTEFPGARSLILATEHQSVRAAAEHCGGTDEIAVDSAGRLDLNDLKNKLTDSVALISASLANNELGAIQDLAEVSRLIADVKQDRFRRGVKVPLYLHSDASQAQNLLNISVARLGADLLTINSAKVYGPKGVGALFVGRGVRLHPVIFGGGQESGLRSGTENVPALIGFSAAAVSAAEHAAAHRKKFENFKKIFKSDLKPALRPELADRLQFLGDPRRQLANFCPLAFPGLDAERLIYLLEDDGVYVSTGAACAASKGERSHVLTAAGLPDDVIAGSLRVTFGEPTSESDVRTAAKKIAAAANREWERKNG